MGHLASFDCKSRDSVAHLLMHMGSGKKGDNKDTEEGRGWGEKGRRANTPQKNRANYTW